MASFSERAVAADRARRRRRLRAVHRHPLPPGSAARARARGGDRESLDTSGRAVHVRRGDRRDRDARDVAARRQLPVRRRDRRRRHRRVHRDRRADAAAGAAVAVRARCAAPPRAPRAARGPARASATSRPLWSRWAADLERRPGSVRRGRARRADRDRDPVLLDAPRLHRRRHRSRRARRRARPTTCSRRASGPATTARCSWSRRCARRRSATVSQRVVQVVAHTPASPASRHAQILGSATRRARRGASPRSTRSGSPQAASTSDLLSDLRGTIVPQATRGTGAARPRRRRDRGLPGLQRRADQQAAAVRRNRRAHVVPAADDGVPQPRRPADRRAS